MAPGTEIQHLRTPARVRHAAGTLPGCDGLRTEWGQLESIAQSLTSLVSGLEESD